MLAMYPTGKIDMTKLGGVYSFYIYIYISGPFNFFFLLLKWTYKTGNSWGTDPDGTSCVGCGPQEHFRACADIKINGDDNDPEPTAAPPTTSNPVQTSTGNSPVITTESPTNAPCNGVSGNYKRVCCTYLCIKYCFLYLI